MRQQGRLRLRNRGVRAAVRTAVKRALAAIESGDPEAAQTAVLAAQSKLDAAARKGIIHKNNAARRLSRLVKRRREASAAATD